jgi:hypothetical protein
MSLLQDIQRLFSKHSPVSKETHETITTSLDTAKQLSENLLVTSQTLQGLVDSLVKRQDLREAARERLERIKNKGWPT